MEAEGESLGKKKPLRKERRKEIDHACGRGMYINGSSKRVRGIKGGVEGGAPSSENRSPPEASAGEGRKKKERAREEKRKDVAIGKLVGRGRKKIEADKTGGTPGRKVRR